MSPQAGREAVETLMTERAMGVTRACGLVGISRSVFRYEPKRAEANVHLKARLAALAAEKRRYGYPRLHVLIRREGHVVNWKRLYRLYRHAGLAVRRRKRKRIGPVERRPLLKPTMPNVSWSMDFVSDGLPNGRLLRCLTIVDDCTRECLAIEVDTSLPARGLRRRSTDSPNCADCRNPSPSTTGPSSRVGSSMRGPMRGACAWRSSARASRGKTPTSRASMAGWATNA